MDVPDADLNKLLDDALLDFDKPAEKQDSKSAACSTNKTEPSASGGKKNSPQKNESTLAPPVNVFNEFFDENMSQQLQAEWHQAVKELCEESPELLEHLKDVPQAAGSSGSVAASSSSGEQQQSDFKETMKAALENMSHIASKADNAEDIDEEELVNGMLNFNLGGEENSNPMGMMENLMKSMLSKEMLYPPMKEMCQQYPKWLQENSSKLSDADRAKYSSQLNCLERLCKEYESETDSDSSDVQSQRFVSIMDIIQEMQSYGQPPEELLVGGKSLPQPENCCIS